LKEAQMRRIVLLFVALFALAQPPAGYNLSLAEAQRLEDSLQKNPGDTTAHTTLLAYYFRNGLRDMAPEKVKEARRRHILWLIEHHPEDRLAGAPEARVDLGGYLADPEGYVQAAAAWRKATAKPEASAAVLANAAHFFTLTEMEFAASLLDRALKANPKDPGAARDLALNYRMQARRAKDEAGRAALARKAFEQMESAAKLDAGPVARFYLLTNLATMALDAGDAAKARGYATELLEIAPQFPKNWNYGNAIHVGNLVLGRLAVRSGDLDKAREHLLAAGKTPGSPQLNSFGPNMALALELLEKGERDAVVQYLELCGQFWKMDRGRLDLWKAAVRGGGIPSFGANLFY
jgi:tetratricopeptide (TPR) repeat protein